MKEWKINRVWQIAYPILVYYVLYNVFYMVLCFLFGGVMDRLFWLGVASLLTLPFLVQIYRKLPIVRAEKTFDSTALPKEGLMILVVVLLGVGLNLLVSHTPLVEVSEGYASANETLFTGDFFSKVFANCICIPVLEELVYRGIVCGQLKLWYSPKTAVIISAFLFGIMHFNVVQFLYGFLVGMAISAVYVKTSRLWVVMVAHGLTNFVVVLAATLGV